MKVLVTGGDGFIGSNFILHTLKNFNNLFVPIFSAIPLTFLFIPLTALLWIEKKRYGLKRHPIISKDLI